MEKETKEMMEPSNLAKEFHGIKINVTGIGGSCKIYAVMSEGSPAICGPTEATEQSAIESWNSIVTAPFDATTSSTARYAAQEII